MKIDAVLFYLFRKQPCSKFFNFAKCFVLSHQSHIALLGNPNSGKTSLFNAVTGLNHKVGNFPGVTVEKKSGNCHLPLSKDAVIIDLPGSYSLYPRRSDEWVSYDALMNPWGNSNIDLFIVVADASNLPRNLLYVSQVVDLGKPVIVALTMMDLAAKKGMQIDVQNLSKTFNVPFVAVNPRLETGLESLDEVISNELLKGNLKTYREPFVLINEHSMQAVRELKQLFPAITDYASLHFLVNHSSFNLADATHEKIEDIIQRNNFKSIQIQAEDIQKRYAKIREIVRRAVLKKENSEQRIIAEKLDGLFLHRKWGNLIMLFVLFIMFQAVFWLAEYPMNAIEWSFGVLSSWLGGILKDSWVSDLIINGVIAGMSGILIFIPQIMILFGMITFLEDTGYMARISFLTDRLMRKIGLNGKSVMPMISGFACAVPAIMSARNIENRKERLLTILTTPLMSCSARLPVYSILIALVIPKVYFLGFLSLHGLVMLALYMLGLVLALIMSAIFNLIINIKEKSFFVLELPIYRPPRWGNIGLTMVQKAKIFVLDAGKVIMIISLVLWGLSSFGPGSKRNDIKNQYDALIKLSPTDRNQLESEKDAKILENSYAGIIGKWIEPLIKPLGYDWKIGIALVTSFAAREVFVGTMATLYSVGNDTGDNDSTLREKMQLAVRTDGSKVYTLATGVSLMIFYVLAMQCMSTLAIVRRETGSWKWPFIQFIYMTGLAYILSMLSYWLLK